MFTKPTYDSSLCKPLFQHPKQSLGSWCNSSKALISSGVFILTHTRSHSPCTRTVGKLAHMFVRQIIKLTVPHCVALMHLGVVVNHYETNHQNPASYCTGLALPPRGCLILLEF